MPPISAPAVIYQAAERAREGVEPRVIWRGTEWDGDFLYENITEAEAKRIRIASASAFGRVVKGRWTNLNSSDIRGAIFISQGALSGFTIDVRGPAAAVLAQADW